MVSLNNTCTVHFICQCFNLWSFLWLCLNAILLFISDKNFSAMSLEFLDFRVLIMNILCLFQCPCLTRTALAFKSPLSELSGKWCSHAMGLSCIFSIFSSYAEIKFMLSLGQVGVLQHNFGFWWCLLFHTELGGQKEMKNSLSSVWHWVLWPGTAAAGAGPWAHLSLFCVSVQEQCLCCSSRTFPNRSLTSHEFLPKEFVFLNQHFQTGKKKFGLLLLATNGQTESPWERLHPSHPVQCGPDKYPVTK